MGAPAQIDLAALFGVPPGTRYVTLVCPAHQDGGRPNLVVWPDGSYCFRCGFRETPAELLRRLAAHPEQARSVVPGRRGKPAASIDWEVRAHLAHHHLVRGARRQRQDYLVRERGLALETVERALLGHDGLRFTVPYRDQDGRVVGIKYRADPAYAWNGPRYQNSPGLGTRLFRPNPRGWPTLVVEGELDALLASQYGVDGVTVSTGAASLARLTGPLPRRAVVATDWDEAGEKAARELLARHPGWVRLPAPVPGVKDLGEWLVSLPPPSRGRTLREVLLDQLGAGKEDEAWRQSIADAMSRRFDRE